MDTSTGSYIYRWLAAVETPGDSPQHGLSADNHLSPTGISPSPYTADGQCSPRNEVRHDLSGPVRQQPSTMDVPSGTNAQEKEHCYERRPRHKTKPDRYEYKGQVSARGSHRSSGKPRKRLSRARKHTINDHFHAFNVPAKRLTLPSCTASGIFGKGKTSSPVRTGLQKRASAPCLAFSKVVLSHHAQHNTEDPCMSPQDEDGADQPQREGTSAVKLAQDSLYQNLGSQFEDTEKCPDMRVLHQPSVIQSHRSKKQGLDNYQIMDHEGLEVINYDSDRIDKSNVAQTRSDLYEACTKQLLDYDLDVQPTALDSVVEDFTLGRVKEILKERVNAWDQSTKGVPGSEDQTQVQDFRKRIRSSSIGAESGADRSYKKQRMFGLSQVETMAAAEAFHVPSHDFDLYSQTSSVADVPHRGQQEAAFETLSFFSDLEGPSESELPDGASDVEKKLRSTLRLDSTEEICSQTFLAAYSMIVHDTDGCSEPGPSGDLSHEWSTWLVSGHQDAHDPMDNATSFIGSGRNEQARDFFIYPQPGVDEYFEAGLGRLESLSIQRPRKDPWHTNDAERQEGDIADTLEGFWRRVELHW